MKISLSARQISLPSGPCITRALYTAAGGLEVKISGARVDCVTQRVPVCPHNACPLIYCVGADRRNPSVTSFTFVAFS
jgi:hypothetical protein